MTRLAGGMAADKTPRATRTESGFQIKLPIATPAVAPKPAEAVRAVAPFAGRPCIDVFEIVRTAR
jgi:hypothetical protein